MTLPRWALAAIAVIIAVLLAWHFWPRDRLEVGESAQLEPAKEVRTVERIIERPKIVYVYPQKTKSDLALPQDVVADQAKKAIATGKLDAEDRPYTLTAVLDTETGESSVYARPDPLPWVVVSTRRNFGAYIGALDGEQAIALTARQEALRIKGLKVEAIAIGAMSQSERFAFVGVGASW